MGAVFGVTPVPRTINTPARSLADGLVQVRSTSESSGVGCKFVTGPGGVVSVACGVALVLATVE